MEKNPTGKQQQPEESFDWESRLEKLRQTRQINAPYTHAPLIRESAQEKQRQETESLKPDAKTRDKVLLDYLEQWQREHNAEVEKGEEVETDAMVLLQENWLSAQSSLQMKASDKQIESTRTVWFNPKHQKTEFAVPETAEVPVETTGDGENGDTAASDGLTDGQQPRITFNINVLNPQAVNRKEVFCLSEKELAERLISRMKPHLADAVNGMIRVAVQKQVALFTYQLQQLLNEQAPQLVEEVLAHNVERVLTDIKYEMKYKR